MSKKYSYLFIVLIILVIAIAFLPSGKGYYIGDVSCDSIDMCECASGYVHTKSIGSVEIPYYFSSCTSTHQKIARNTAEMKKYAREQEKQRVKRLNELFESKSCDIGWIFVNDHCERCDSSETFKVTKSDCLKCNQYEELRVYDSRSKECKLKE